MAATMKSTSFAPIVIRPTPRSRQLRIWALVTLAGLIVLTACSNRGSTAATTVSSPMTPALRLALGTLHLESTDQAVDAATAAQLLPLWQLMGELSTNSAASPAEIAAVLERIESAMTASQRTAIQALNLTDANVADSLKGNDGTIAAASTASTGSVRVSSAAGPVLGAEIGGAGMPLDGGGPMPGAGLQQRTSTLGNAGTSRNASLIQEVIQLLERKLQD